MAPKMAATPSAISPTQIITASGKDKGRLSPADFVRVDAHGQPTLSEQPKSSAETLLHCVLAKQEGIGAILHTHSVWATLLSDIHFSNGGIHIEDFEMLKGLDGVTTHEHREWVKIYDNTQDIASLSEVVERDFQDGQLAHGFLMRHHGLYTWGPTLGDAQRHIEVFEFLFECVARKSILHASM